jgi:exoribonuclease II
MNVLYEENGDFKVGSVLSETDASLQVEAPHGKRSKIKSAHVLLRFEDGSLASFLERVGREAQSIDTDFLWECCRESDFGFEELAAEYHGRKPTAAEAATVLIKLHSAPMYFHRKGRGRFRAAPPDTLKAALAGLERKRVQAEQIDGWAAQMQAGEMPEALRPMLRELLYKPDRNRSETKALEKACLASGLSGAKLLAACGMLPSTHDYHFNRFLYEQFPGGVALPALARPSWPEDLPLAEVEAFSLDDATTTEIDDAMSLTFLPGGGWRLGVHIAAPALGFGPGSAIDAIARERLSTAYMPGRKITMLPEEVIDVFTLAAGRSPPALSLYLDIDPQSFAVTGSSTRIERVPVAANLRHHEVERLNEDFLADKVDPAVPYAAQLHALYRFALALEEGRGKSANNVDRLEYSFHVEGERIEIVPRKRGAPLDKLVAELMILVNSHWGRLLDERGVSAIYRTQNEGKVRMSTAAAGHQGLGVSHYAWSSSPLRRYVDLVNQWQLIAALRAEAPPFAANSEALHAAVRDFELTYAAYDEFQRNMEQYWCLRFIEQEGIREAAAEVVRDKLVRFRKLPLYTRVPSLPELAPGTAVLVEVKAVDLIDSEIRCLYKKPDEGKPSADA